MLDVLRLLSPIPHTSQLHLQFDLRYSSSTNWRCIVSNVNGFPARRTVCASFTLGGQGKQSVPSRLGRRNPVVFECSWERFEIDGASGWFDVVLACFSPMPKYHDRAMRHTNRHYQSRQDSEAQHGKLHLNFEVEGATNMQGSQRYRAQLRFRAFARVSSHGTRAACAHICWWLSPSNTNFSLQRWWRGGRHWDGLKAVEDSMENLALIMFLTLANYSWNGDCRGSPKEILWHGFYVNSILCMIHTDHTSSPSLDLAYVPWAQHRSTALASTPKHDPKICVTFVWNSLIFEIWSTWQSWRQTWFACTTNPKSHAVRRGWGQRQTYASIHHGHHKIPAKMVQQIK